MDSARQDTEGVTDLPASAQAESVLITEERKDYEEFAREDRSLSDIAFDVSCWNGNCAWRWRSRAQEAASGYVGQAARPPQNLVCSR